MLCVPHSAVGHHTSMRLLPAHLEYISDRALQGMSKRAPVLLARLEEGWRMGVPVQTGIRPVVSLGEVP